MKIKEVQAGVKLTKNYDSYQASLVAEIETGEKSRRSRGSTNGKSIGDRF